jgi:hypothetical protein
MSDLIIDPTDYMSFRIPDVIDPDGNSYKIRVDLGSALTFVTYENGVFTIKSEN